MKTLFSLIFALFFIPFMQLSLAWESYESISYDLDFDGDSVKEIIIKKDIGAGNTHFLKELRIYKDTCLSEDNSEMELIFSIITFEKWYGIPGRKAEDIIQEVTFTEPDVNTGLRKIVVNKKKLIYEGESWYDSNDSKHVNKVKDFGTTVYKWTGNKYEKDIE